MLEQSTWMHWPDRVPGVCNIGSTLCMPQGFGRALQGSLICSDEKIGVPLYAQVRTILVLETKNSLDYPDKIYASVVDSPLPPIHLGRLHARVGSSSSLIRLSGMCASVQNLGPPRLGRHTVGRSTRLCIYALGAMLHQLPVPSSIQTKTT